MKIAVIGGGNIGTLLAAEFARKNYVVTIYSSRPERWGNTLEVYLPDETLLFQTDHYSVTDSLDEAVLDADHIWITLPSFMLPEFEQKLYPLIKEGQVILCVPGSGGAEFCFAKEIKRGCILSGLQRVHSIARVKEYGKSVYMLGRKDSVCVGSIPRDKAKTIAQVLSEMLDMPCFALENYLAVTLTPSNPILHTSRLYSMFQKYHSGMCYDHNIRFYEEWTDDASRVMLACDWELQNLCRALSPLDMEAVRSLKEHYESDTVEKMTAKIQSITAFQGLSSPMIQTEGGWIPDFSSRYFNADFAYGLKVILDIGKLFGVDMPQIEKIWEWYLRVSKAEQYFRLPMMTRQDFIEVYL